MAGVQVGRGLDDVRVNDIRVCRRVVVLVHRVRRVGVLTELPVETPPGVFVVRPHHD